MTRLATLAAYHVDERRSVWTHVRELARLTGAELSSAGAGRSTSARSRRAADHTLRHGADLVAWDVGPRGGAGTAVSVVPFGAASEEGTAKWHILLREPEGSSPKGPVIVAGGAARPGRRAGAADALRRAPGGVRPAARCCSSATARSAPATLSS